MNTFWQKLPKPFFALAPMEDITDAAFRRLVSEYTKSSSPVTGYVSWTEFVSADGLILADEKGKKKIMQKLIYHESERPVVAQLFTSLPEHMEKAAALCAELGFDGIDINMGCPVKVIDKQGCGAALIKNPKLAVQLIRAAKRGTQNFRHSVSEIPVSVKTRAGYRSDYEMEEWLTVLLNEKLAALTLHARTRMDMSKVSARWELVKHAVEIRDEISPETKIIGNGDVESVEDGKKRAEETGCDGVMIGRAAIGTPWIFLNFRHSVSEIGKGKRLQALKRHLELFIEIFEDDGHFPPMKKHVSKYVTGFKGAKELRMKLMKANTAQDALAVLTENM